eukprot:scaffold85320_cov19-Tisochrysis_lutea.AAC.2
MGLGSFGSRWGPSMREGYSSWMGMWPSWAAKDSHAVQIMHGVDCGMFGWIGFAVLAALAQAPIAAAHLKGVCRAKKKAMRMKVRVSAMHLWLLTCNLFLCKLTPERHSLH